MNFLVLIISFIAAAQTPMMLTHDQQVTVLQEAQVAYDQGVMLRSSNPVASKVSFQRASDRYQLLIDDGIENGLLWYNLGNSYLQIESVGEAIAAYRSAQRYIPTNERLLANLQYARTLVENPFEQNEPTFLQRLTYLHRALPIRIRFFIAIAFWSILWIGFSARVFNRYHGFKTIIVIAGFIAVVSGLSVSIDVAYQRQHHGVIVAEEAIVRKGNGTNYAPMFQKPIHEGIEFTIIEERGHWLYIELPNGTHGWIQEDDAMIVSLEMQQKKQHS